MTRLEQVLEQAKAVVQLLEQIAAEQEQRAAEAKQLLFSEADEKETLPGEQCPYHHTLCRCPECLACGCDHHKLWNPTPDAAEKETPLCSSCSQRTGRAPLAVGRRLSSIAEGLCDACWDAKHGTLAEEQWRQRAGRPGK